ncbi:hypothetical protein Pmani_000257 [Petrolisthes manimaculis]|uniref:Uncharacterized protein n=1 Tax=Petrolisthes manimaculis TaxID=1843537 RepID=A0AAE1UMJ3_9EUCA|nr:hypothetical protein Pmani_000257 [Petrolisthes manimaculis]
MEERGGGRLGWWSRMRQRNELMGKGREGGKCQTEPTNEALTHQDLSLKISPQEVRREGEPSGWVVAGVGRSKRVNRGETE